MGGLTLMMVPGRRPSGDPADVNRLLDAAFASLAELGDEIYGAFVRDQIGFADFMRFMRATAKRRPDDLRRSVRTALAVRDRALDAAAGQAGAGEMVERVTGRSGSVARAGPVATCLFSGVLGCARSEGALRGALRLRAREKDMWRHPPDTEPSLCG